MNLKICTFNILNEKNVYGNLKCDITKYSNDDNKFRISVIIQILINNEYDVIFLQEVGLLFRENNEYQSKLNQLYHIIYSKYKQNWLCILINKNKFTDIRSINTEIYKDRFASDTILNAILIVEAQLKNQTSSRQNNMIISFVDMHLMTEIANKQDTIQLVKKYINQPNLNNVIIAGDMNDEENIFTDIAKLRKLQIKNNTSYSLGLCVGNTMVHKTTTAIYRKLDHIYISDNMVISDTKIYDDFDNKTFKLLLSNTFETYGPPFCFTDGNRIKDCCIYEYMHAFNNLSTKWPSDHLLVEAKIITPKISNRLASPSTINKTRPQTNLPSGLSATAREFKPMAQQTYNQYGITKPVIYKFGGGSELDYLRRYQKYKIKYTNLKEKQNTS